jgi:hypothetical protein
VEFRCPAYLRHVSLHVYVYAQLPALYSHLEACAAACVRGCLLFVMSKCLIHRFDAILPDAAATAAYFTCVANLCEKALAVLGASSNAFTERPDLVVDYFRLVCVIACLAGCYRQCWYVFFLWHRATACAKRTGAAALAGMTRLRGKAGL